MCTRGHRTRLCCYNWIVVYLEKLWANFPLLPSFFATSNSISKESRKNGADGGT